EVPEQKTLETVAEMNMWKTMQLYIFYIVTFLLMIIKGIDCRPGYKHKGPNLAEHKRDLDILARKSDLGLENFYAKWGVIPAGYILFHELPPLEPPEEEEGLRRRRGRRRTG
ncbi:unnamed protein product, partial [Owenia fusiformis]